MLEIPAGMRDVEGESTLEVARRELIEEAGLEAERFEQLTVMYPSPGMTDSTTTLYVATECSVVPTDRHGPEEEHMEIRHLPLDDAVDLVERGEICDAKSALAILLTVRRLERADGRLP
jgi:ADP-ribose pyrophosphatase